MSKHGIILITGSRSEFNRDRIELGILRAQKLLEDMLPKTREITKFSIFHGKAKGADQTAGECGQRWGYPVFSFPADWAQDGKAAGPIRNQRMVDGVVGELGVGAAQAAVCVAFPRSGSIGTWDCVKRAYHAGLTVLIQPETGI